MKEYGKSFVPGARYLSMQELHHTIDRQLAEFISSGEEQDRDYVSGALTNFVEQNVSGTQVNGTNVISVDFDAREAEVDPFFRQLIASPETEAVFVEYFDSDFRGNKRLRSLLYGGHDAGENLAHRALQNINSMPILRNKQIGTEFVSDFAARERYAGMLADICADNGKLVATADIANTNGYYGAHYGLQSIPSIPYLIEQAAGVRPEWLPYVHLVHHAGWAGSLLYQKAAETGMFSKERLSWVDNVVVDFEQARRMYMAGGVKQVATQVGDGETGSKQILIGYPRAHAIRIEDEIVNPKPRRSRVRHGIYQAVGKIFGTDANVRTWSHNPASGWQEMSSNRILIAK